MVFVLLPVGINSDDQSVNATVNDLLLINNYLIGGDTSGRVLLKAADTVTNYTIKLPGSQGANDTYLKNDGSGNLSWSSAGSTAKVFNNPTRSLNTGFQISSTRDTEVSYSVDISCSMSLTGGQSGTAILEYADDSGFTTNVKTVSRGTNANSGTLTIGLALVQVGAANLAGVIPAGKYTRIRTVNNTGTPTFTLQNSQETLV